MRRFLLPFATIAVLALPAMAQQAATTTTAAAQPIIDKFAVLVPERVIDQSGHCRKLFSGLKVESEQWQEKLQAKAQEGQQLQKQLQATGLSDEGKDKLEKQLRDLQYDFKKTQEDAQASVDKAKQKAGAQFNQDVSPILEQIAKEKGLQAVIQYNPGLFAYLDERAAITFSDEVAKRVDAKFPADAGFQVPGAPSKPATKPTLKK